MFFGRVYELNSLEISGYGSFLPMLSLKYYLHLCVCVFAAQCVFYQNNANVNMR